MDNPIDELGEALVDTLACEDEATLFEADVATGGEVSTGVDECAQEVA